MIPEEIIEKVNMAKLVYSDTYNQYYEILKIDVANGVCYIKIVSNRRDKSIRKDMILKIENEIHLKFVVMHDINTMADHHFIKIMESGCPYKIKLNELSNFERNMLIDSSIAMDKLKSISETNPKNDVDKKVQCFALKTLTSFNQKDIKKSSIDNRDSYNQFIPPQIMKLALSKRLFIERRDEFIKLGRQKGLKRIPAPANARKGLQVNLPCGYLIRSKYGDVIAGKRFTMTDQEVIEFIKYYIPIEEGEHNKSLYKVPMSLRKERHLERCYNILKHHGLGYKNEHNYFFWILNKNGKVIAGGKEGFGYKWFEKYCRRLNKGAL